MRQRVAVPRSRSATARSSGWVSFRFRSSPATQATAQAGGGGDRRVVGVARMPGRAVRAQDLGEAEALRRLRPGKAVAVGLAQHGCAVHPLERVHDRQCGQGRGCSSRAASTRSIRAADTSGRAASWISTRSRRQLDQALQPGPHGGLAGRAADHGWQQVETCGRVAIEFRVAGTDDHPDRIDARMAGKRHD